MRRTDRRHKPVASDFSRECITATGLHGKQKPAVKAKQEPRFRFYVLVLWSAWQIVRRMIGEIMEALKSKTCMPQPVKRVHIPKGDGKTRPLGIPTVGYRPGKSAHQALDVIGQNLKEGRTAVYDAGLKGYFDSIPHDKLMKAVEFRIADRQVLHLIRLWLTAPVIEKDEQGRTTRKRPDKGTPQGGVISPLLANLYLHWFDKVFHGKDGPLKFANARLIRFADDFVIIARYVGERMTNWVESKIETWLGLVINREKTKVVQATMPGETLDFLAYSFRYDKDLHGRNCRYWNRIPSKKAMRKACASIHELTSGRWCCLPIDEVVRRLNQFLVGWSNYFGKGYPRCAFRSINAFVLARMTQFLGRQSQRPFKPPKGMSWYHLIYEVLKVKQL